MNRKYKNNFLKQVIARVDFLNLINEIKEQLAPDITDICKKYFPISESKSVKKLETKIQLGADKHHIVEQSQEQFTEWHFYGKKREKHLLITPSFMYVEFLKYESFEELSDHFLSITDKLFSVVNNLQVKRFGLRYINNIKVPGKNKFSWGAYLNKNLLSIFNIAPDKNIIARAFHNLELNFGDYTLRFQYGMHNPDYPAPIRQKIFVLDYDTYTTGILANEEIRNLLPKFHEEIEKMFEDSITDKLRGIMDA